ncbi:MAG: hypothetical protein IPK33_08315 [Gemmatimonadetes bacterium]|nr:hypothetical protein [Gemmatimonadota bacterium]
MKANHQSLLQAAATECGVSLELRRVKHPANFFAAHALLESARRISEDAPSLVVDISAMPRDLALYLTDILCGLVDRFYTLTFREVFFVVTPPETLTGRAGLGPFSVGTPRCVYQRELLRNPGSSLKTSMLIFPGVEGFESRACIDLLPHTDAHRTVAVNCFDPTLPAALELLIANQSILYDVIEHNAELQYCFSEVDAFRVARETALRAVNLAREFRTMRHAFVIAPFGPKWSVIIASLARAYFKEQCRERARDTVTCSDVLLLPRSQYVSLYSRGSGVPRAFRLS